MNIFQNKYFQISFAILILYSLVWILFGQNSYILIHDNLDSNVVWFKTLVASGKIFASSSSIIPSFMSAPRGSFGTEYSLLLWINYFFEPYTAYVVNQILIRIVAYFGMYYLLKRYILKREEKYAFAIALLYSLLPFWPSGGLSVAGLPLITFVFLDIRNNIDKAKDWLILILFPFYSSFVLSMMFYIIFVGFIWIYDIFKKKFTYKFTLALFLFGFIYLFVNYRLLEIFVFGTEFISHRTEFSTHYYGFWEAVVKSLKHLESGQYHAASLHIVFLPFVFVVFIYNLFSKNRDKLLILLFVLNILISLWYGFWKYEGWESIKESISILNSINLSRFHFLTPLIWYVLFALSIRYTIENYSSKYKYIIINFFIIISLFFLFVKSDYIHEYKKNNISYKEFYAQQLFKKIDEFIHKDKSSYKVVSIGIHPAIASYNGFYTIDGYLGNYPLQYKHQFRKIISNELVRNKRLEQRFDNWGSRCYIFSSEIGYNYVRKKDKVYPINIFLNTKVLKKMGGDYIFSSYKILNTKENNLKFLKIFKDKDAAWDIYLYEVMEHK